VFVNEDILEELQVLPVEKILERKTADTRNNSLTIHVSEEEEEEEEEEE
jgi:hypothetical protein